MFVEDARPIYCCEYQLDEIYDRHLKLRSQVVEFPRHPLFAVNEGDAGVIDRITDMYLGHSFLLFICLDLDVGAGPDSAAKLASISAGVPTGLICSTLKPNGGSSGSLEFDHGPAAAG
jgi:hypothetical protein